MAEAAPAIDSEIVTTTTTAETLPVTDTFNQANTAPTPEPESLPANFKLPRKAQLLGEVFSMLTQFPTRLEKIVWLRHNDSPSLRYVLKLAFDERIQWAVPAGLPPFTPYQGRKYSAPSELYREMRHLYLFLKGGNDALKQVKREKMFQDMCRELDPIEVQVIEAVKDKCVPHRYGLTADTVNLAFPGLIAAPVALKFVRR